MLCVLAVVGITNILAGGVLAIYLLACLLLLLPLAQLP